MSNLQLVALDKKHCEVTWPRTFKNASITSRFGTQSLPMQLFPFLRWNPDWMVNLTWLHFSIWNSILVNAIFSFSTMEPCCICEFIADWWLRRPFFFWRKTTMFGPYATRTNAFAPFPYCVDFLVFIVDWCSRRPSYSIFVDYIGSHFDRIWFSFLSIAFNNLWSMGSLRMRTGSQALRTPRMASQGFGVRWALLWLW